MTKNPFRPGQGWRAALLHGFAREHASRRRRRTLLLDSLEDRIAPAVAGDLYVVGTTLVYNGNFADNNITVEGSDSAFSLTDTAGTIDSTVPGMSVSGGTVSGAIPSYIQSIAINGQNGTDVINVAGLTTTRNLIVTGTTIDNSALVTAKNVTETGTLVTLGAGISTNGAGPLGGSLLINGSIDVTAAVTLNTTSTLDGNITLNGSVVGSAGLTLDAGTGGNVSTTGAINLGGASALSVTGDTVGLHQIIDGGATTITGQQAVNLNGSLVTSGKVAITANNGGSGPYGFTQVSGDITTTSHTGASDVAVTVGGSGSATVNGITTGAGGEVTFTVGGAILDGNGTGSLNVNTGVGGTLDATAGVGGINLDTSTANLLATVTGSGAGDINIRNTGLALGTTAGTGKLTAVTANGNVNVSNNFAMEVTAGGVMAGGSGHSVTLTTTNPGATNANGWGDLTVDGTIGFTADTVNLNTTGDIVYAGGTVDATALNIDAGTATPSNPASGSVGATGAALNVSGPTGSPIVVTLTTTDASESGVWIKDTASPMTIAQATAQGGVINITTGAGYDLVVAGNVATTATGAVVNTGAITLTSGQDLVLSSGSVTSNTGAITLTQTDNLTIASGVTVASNGAITTTAPSANTIINVSGTLAGSGVTINGSSGGTTTLGVSGTIASSGGGNAITLGGSGSATVMLGGSLATSGATGITLDGSTILTLTGAITSVGTTIDASAATSPVVMNLGGTIQDTGGVAINGAGSAASVINTTGTISSTSTVAISGGASAGGSLDLSATGSITGSTVTITGGDASNTLSIGGSVTATGGAITVDNSAGLASSIVISGETTGTSPTVIDTSDAGDNLVVTPSLSTAIDFSFTGTSVNTLEINTALANIQSSTSSFSGPIAFNNTTKTWVNLATGGMVTVTPTVP